MGPERKKKRDKLRFVKLHLKGDKVTCIAEPREAVQMLADDPNLTGEDVWMSRAQFEELPEFMGW